MNKMRIKQFAKVWFFFIIIWLFQVYLILKILLQIKKKELRVWSKNEKGKKKVEVECRISSIFKRSWKNKNKINLEKPRDEKVGSILKRLFKIIRYGRMMYRTYRNKDNWKPWKVQFCLLLAVKEVDFNSITKSRWYIGGGRRKLCIILMKFGHG